MPSTNDWYRRTRSLLAIKAATAYLQHRFRSSRYLIDLLPLFLSWQLFTYCLLVLLSFLLCHCTFAICVSRLPASLGELFCSYPSFYSENSPTFSSQFPFHSQRLTIGRTHLFLYRRSHRMVQHSHCSRTVHCSPILVWWPVYQQCQRRCRRGSPLTAKSAVSSSGFLSGANVPSAKRIWSGLLTFVCWMFHISLISRVILFFRWHFLVPFCCSICLVSFFGNRDSLLLFWVMWCATSTSCICFLRKALCNALSSVPRKDRFGLPCLGYLVWFMGMSETCSFFCLWQCAYLFFCLLFCRCFCFIFRPGLASPFFL